MRCNALCRRLDGIKFKPAGRVNTVKLIRHQWLHPSNPKIFNVPNLDCDAVVDNCPSRFAGGLFCRVVFARIPAYFGRRSHWVSRSLLKWKRQ